MPTPNTWIVIANSARVKIFRWIHHSKIEVITTLEHPQSRLLNHEFNTDSPGRSFDRGGCTRHSYQSNLDPKEEEADKFSKTVSQHLAKSLENGEFSRLYLIASPSFLGWLNRHLDKKVQETIYAKIPKDLTEFNTADLENYLAAML